MSDLQDALDRLQSWGHKPLTAQIVLDLGVAVQAARKYANLPDFPGFDRWHDALVVRGVSYIDEYRDEDDGLIDWITAVLALGVTETE